MEVQAMKQCMDADNLHRRLKKIIGQVQAIDRMVDEAKAAPSDSPPSRPGRKASWTREDRVKLLAFMESRGIFLMKGALEHAAERLGVSKVTIYSDLDQIRRMAKFGKTPYWRGEE